MNWTDFLWAIPAYFLGSIPTAVWVGRAKYDLDVREHGSKNAGATNTFRVLGKKAGRVVLTIDILKGMLAVLLPYFVLPVPFSSAHLKAVWRPTGPRLPLFRCWCLPIILWSKSWAGANGCIACWCLH